MERSNVIELNISGVSENDEFIIPSINNSDEVNESDREVKRIEDHWEELVFGEKKNSSLETMEKNESGGEFTNSDDEKILSPVKNNPLVANETLDKSKANSSRNLSNEDEAPLNNTLKNEIATGDNEQYRKRSVIFYSSKKPKLRDMGAEDLDDSGIALDNSIKIRQRSAAKSDAGKQASTSKANLSYNDNTSDESEATFNNSTKDKSPEIEADKIGRSKKTLLTKRKLSYHESEDESEEFDNRPNKRRHKYKLRNTVKKNITQEQPEKERGSDELEKDNTSKDDNEEESQDSDWEVEIKPKEKPTRNKAKKKRESEHKTRAVHNNKILRLLNEGSPNELKSLSRIGLKTATMIHQYRKLNGKFKSIRDLGNMPGWSPKIFELFLFANNILLD